MKHLYPLAACVLSMSVVAPLAHAHNLWLQPSTTVLSKPDWVTVDAAVSNDLFYFNHVPLGLDGLSVTGPDGAAVPAQNSLRGRLRSVFDVDLQKPGTYRLAVVNQGLFASYKDAATGQARRWRGSADKLEAEVPANAQDLVITQSSGRVETFVTVGKPQMPTPVGQGLELVPQTHPNDLAVGEKATFALWIDGQPASGVAVTVVAGASRYRDKLAAMAFTTDAQGRFSVTWPQAGMYWLEAEAKDRHTTHPRAQERRMTYTVTLEVLP